MKEERFDALQKLLSVFSDRTAALRKRLLPLAVADVADREIEDEMSDRSLTPSPSVVRDHGWAPQDNVEGS